MILHAGAEGVGEMTDNDPNEVTETLEDAFLVTASKLRDRRRRRRVPELPQLSETIRLVELELRAKPKT